MFLIISSIESLLRQTSLIQVKSARLDESQDIQSCLSPMSCFLTSQHPSSPTRVRSSRVGFRHGFTFASPPDGLLPSVLPSAVNLPPPPRPMSQETIQTGDRRTCTQIYHWYIDGTVWIQLLLHLMHESVPILAYLWQPCLPP